eukprot:scaffold2804_cov371-Prasinococcus_capsulatus_cf.AAC.22
MSPKNLVQCSDEAILVYPSEARSGPGASPGCPATRRGHMDGPPHSGPLAEREGRHIKADVLGSGNARGELPCGTALISVWLAPGPLALDSHTVSAGGARGDVHWAGQGPHRSPLRAVPEIPPPSSVPPRARSGGRTPEPVPHSPPPPAPALGCPAGRRAPGRWTVSAAGRWRAASARRSGAAARVDSVDEAGRAQRRTRRRRRPGRRAPCAPPLTPRVNAPWSAPRACARPPWAGAEDDAAPQPLSCTCGPGGMRRRVPVHLWERGTAVVHSAAPDGGTPEGTFLQALSLARPGGGLC